MGPGAAIKAVLGRYFSLTVFGFAQIAIDLEPLIRLLRHDNIVHGITHSYLGAFIIGLFSCFFGKIVCQWLLSAWNYIFSFKYLTWLQVSSNISNFAAFTGSFIGTFSHVLLDSIVHADVQPFWPTSLSNGLLNFIPAAWVYFLCSVFGVIGLMILFVVGLWNKWAIEIK
jgi:hypothetical protein